MSVVGRAIGILSVLTVLYQIPVYRCIILWILFKESHALVTVRKHALTPTSLKAIFESNHTYVLCVEKPRPRLPRATLSTFASMVESPRGRCATHGRCYPMHIYPLMLIISCSVRFPSFAAHFRMLVWLDADIEMLVSNTQERFAVEVAGAPKS